MSSPSDPQSPEDLELGRGQSGISSDDLKAWHGEYTAQDGDSPSFTSDAIRAVESDVLDFGQIEGQVRQLMPTAGVVDGFCAKCKHLLDHWPTLTSSCHRDRPVLRCIRTCEVEAAARLRCGFCAFLLSRLKRKSLLDTFRKIEARLCDIGDAGGALLSIQSYSGLAYIDQLLWLDFPGKGQSQICPQAFTLISQVLLPSVRLPRDSVDDPFETARMWLARCSSSHEHCHGKKQHRLPSRLISIGHGVVKLVVTASLPKPPRYATLSYCWGSEPFTMLTQDNLELFMDHITLDELPQTFRDAINASRQLGIDFIWIDALCIIQKEESNSDWATESGHMSAIYSGTFVTLAASIATSVQEGFLHRSPHHRGGFVARVTTSDYCTVQDFHSGDPHAESTTKTHLATRAWAFQERLLSPRTIYFGDAGLFWECRSCISSEFLLDGSPVLHERFEAGSENKAWDWGEIVWQYSKAKLTYTSDRLPALSGVVARQQEINGDQYLAGMWRESLVTELQWTRMGKKSRRPGWRAPTWSWAAIDGEARYWSTWQYEYRRPQFFIQVLDAWATPSGPDPFGAVADGELTLSCTHLVRGQLITDGSAAEQDVDLVQMGPGLVRFPVLLDCLLEASTPDDYGVHLLPIVEDETGLADTDEETGEVLWEQLVIRGLVLRACGDAKGLQHFQRIGGFSVRNKMDEGVEDSYQVFMDALRKEDLSVAGTDPTQTVSVSEDRERRFVIVIK